MITTLAITARTSAALGDDGHEHRQDHVEIAQERRRARRRPQNHRPTVPEAQMGSWVVQLSPT
jgi:hypothetical protein